MNTATYPVNSSQTTARLASITLAVAMTMVTLLGVDSLAGVQSNAAKMAQTTPSAQS